MSCNFKKDRRLCDLVTDVAVQERKTPLMKTLAGRKVMYANVGSADRLIRIILGLVLIALAFVLAWGTLGTIVSALIGAVLVITALVRFCPAYRLLGIHTCKV